MASEHHQKGHPPVLSLLCLGTGAGSTMVYDSEASSSLLIKWMGRALLLLDLGLGVASSVRQIARCAIPSSIYISHNHSDHAGELPVVIAVESKAGRDMKVYAEPEVLDRLLTHRLHELRSTGRPLEDFASFVPCPCGDDIEVEPGLLTVRTVRARHSETTYGLVVSHEGRAVLGWTSDSGFDADLYSALATTGAETLVFDARYESSAEHASFEEVRQWVQYELPRVVYGAFGAAAVLPSAYCIGYGTQGEVPGENGLGPLRVLRPGDAVILAGGPVGHVSREHQASQRAQSVGPGAEDFADLREDSAQGVRRGRPRGPGDVDDSESSEGSELDEVSALLRMIGVT